MIKRLQMILMAALLGLSGYLAYDLFGKARENAVREQQEAAYREYVLGFDSGELPSRFDAREIGRQPTVKDQGDRGTCWAVATSSALETYFLPGEQLVFSADHISMQNSFAMEVDDGGGYTMAMAYLAGWQGPVLEEDDPYGDGVSPNGLTPTVHVQEIQSIKNKDYEAIKRAVYAYGAVQSAIYMDLENAFGSSVYYNQLNATYSYNGDRQANHDVVIIGWDDNFFADRFNVETRTNGAFICQNSWGSEFGDDGVFYVSYEDVNIGENCIVYTKIEEPDNYARLYQTDLCGQTGMLGYGDGDCYFANVYTAQADEELAAVGFYTRGKNSEYEVYVIGEFETMNDFVKQTPLQKGYIEQTGYYTVELETPVPLSAGERFAVVVFIHTPDVSYPVAMEYAADESTKTVDISDGEGYISHNGVVWQNTEETHDCNICLKAYTK